MFFISSAYSPIQSPPVSIFPLEIYRNNCKVTSRRWGLLYIFLFDEKYNNPGFQLKSVFTLTTLLHLYQRDCGFWWPLRFALSVLFRSRLSVVRKLKSGFRIYYSMRFGAFLVSLRKIYASTISTACTSILILLAVLFGFDRNLLRFAVFYYYLHGFAVSYVR